MSNDQNKNSSKLSGKGPKMPFNVYWIYLAALLIIIGLWQFVGDPQMKEVSWSDFQRYAK